ncbi:hypothetical protein HDU76_005068 [Blyttiomyces sp. JEL0837]|nr:hypothetical protein HDU76_005068 [Blyttiomyces sp. JEL0837]
MSDATNIPVCNNTDPSLYPDASSHSSDPVLSGSNSFSVSNDSIQDIMAEFDAMVDSDPSMSLDDLEILDLPVMYGPEHIQHQRGPSSEAIARTQASLQQSLMMRAEDQRQSMEQLARVQALEDDVRDQEFMDTRRSVDEMIINQNKRKVVTSLESDTKKAKVAKGHGLKAIRLSDGDKEFVKSKMDELRVTFDNINMMKTLLTKNGSPHRIQQMKANLDKNQKILQHQYNGLNRDEFYINPKFLQSISTNLDSISAYISLVVSRNEETRSRRNACLVSHNHQPLYLPA